MYLLYMDIYCLISMVLQVLSFISTLIWSKIYFLHLPYFWKIHFQIGVISFWVLASNSSVMLSICLVFLNILISFCLYPLYINIYWPIAMGLHWYLLGNCYGLIGSYLSFNSHQEKLVRCIDTCQVTLKLFR